MLSSAPTWGITGPAFLLLYLVLAVASLVAAAVHRNRVAGRAPEPQLDRLHPYALAHLAGGPDRAIAAAVGALRADGVVEPQQDGGRTRLRPTGRPLTPSAGERPAWGSAGPAPSPAADALDRAVLEQVRQGLPVHRVMDSPDGAAALTGLRAELVAAGALLSPEQRSAARAAALWPAGVTLLGVLRVSAGLQNDRPIGLIVLGTLVMLTLSVLVWGRPPLAHPTVNGGLDRIRDGSPHLAASQAPSLATYGAATAATAVALGGFAVLAAADPAMAQSEELTDLQQRMAAASASSSGGDTGVGYGGDSGGGGDGGGGDGGGGCGGCGG